jgi:putative endonuclease
MELIVYHVYLIKSVNHPEITYVGYTTDIKQRLAKHNSGGSPHTSKYVPWQLIVYLTFSEKKVASEFERYLKTQSGRAFAAKRFLIAP